MTEFVAATMWQLKLLIRLTDRGEFVGKVDQAIGYDMDNKILSLHFALRLGEVLKLCSGALGCEGFPAMGLRIAAAKAARAVFALHRDMPGIAGNVGGR